jgi:hypothetical protein
MNTYEVYDTFCKNVQGNTKTSWKMEIRILQCKTKS